jgi:hypothetical protein
MSIGNESTEEKNSNNQTQEIGDIPEVTSSNRDALNQTVNKYVQKPTLKLHSPKEIKKVRPFPTSGTQITPQRILLFEKTTKIGKKDFLVEISRDKLHLFIIAFRIEPSKSKSGYSYYTMQIPIKQAFKLLMELDNSFDSLIGLLYLNYNTLLLPDFLRTKFSPRNIHQYGISRTTTNQEGSRPTSFRENSAIITEDGSKPLFTQQTKSKESIEKQKQGENEGNKQNDRLQKKTEEYSDEPDFEN